MKQLLKKLFVFIFKILLKVLSVFFSKKNKLILCFDCLYDVNQEQIDAYILFKFLKGENIKTKYIALKNSNIDDDKDVIFVKNKWEFLFKHLFLILSSGVICTSFGLFDGIDAILKECKLFEYVFLEHGVTYIKNENLKLYTNKTFNKILVPSKLTYNLYKENNCFDDNDMILSGLPRWDNLIKSFENNRIFVFFSWRKTFLNNPKCAKKYIDEVIDILNLLSRLIPLNIEICFAWHHEILKNKIEIKKINQRVKLINSKKISTVINNSDLLITDFSSLSFDYFYLFKPVIFYRFDFDENYLNNADKINYKALKEIDKIIPNCVYDRNEFIEKISSYLRNSSSFIEKSENFSKEIFWDLENNSKKICDELNLL